MAKCFVISTATAALLSLTSATSPAQTTWVKHPANPVIPHWTGDVDDPSGYKYAFGPAVMDD